MRGRYKGKRVDNSEWKEGYLFRDFHIHNGKRTEHFFIGEAFDDIYNPEDNYEEVIPKTVRSQTGRRDKNGKEIYEGEVVKLSNNPIHEGTLVVCEWIEEIAGFYYRFLTGQYKGKLTDMRDDWRDYESVGNDIDNPELLESEVKNG